MKKYNALLNLGEKRLKHDFICGLNSENELEAQLCYSIDPDLSLEDLVADYPDWKRFLNLINNNLSSKSLVIYFFG